MSFRLEATVGTPATRRAVFEALLGAILSRAGPFQSSHAELSEDFYGYRIRVADHELNLSFRPTRDSGIVAVHRGPAGTRRYCLGPGSWAALSSTISSVLALLHGDEFEIDHTLAARLPIGRDGTVVF